MQWFEASISSFSLASEHQTVSSLSQIPIIPFFFFFNSENRRVVQHNDLRAHQLNESNTFNSDGPMPGFN